MQKKYLPIKCKPGKHMTVHGSAIAACLVMLFLLISYSPVADAAQKCTGDFCQKHQLAEKDCPWCNSDLVRELGWCNGHDMAEAFCYRCNAKLKAGFIAENDWCKEHQVPESQCTLCGAPAKADIPKGTKSNQPRIFHAPARACKTDTLKVQLKSPAFAKAAGFEFFKASKQPLEQTITRNAEIKYNRKKYARLSSPVPGTIKEARVDPGQAVKTGEVLFIINSADVGRAKSEYLQAGAMVELWEKNYRRESELLKLKALEKKRILQTQNRLTQFRLQLSRAAGTLNNLGYSNAQMKQLAKNEDTSPYLPLKAPFPGIILDYSITPGEAVAPHMPIIEMADVSGMWCMMELLDHDISRIKKGQRITFELLDFEAKKFPGQITWVSSKIDPRTRTFKARAEISNPEAFLKAGVFGKARIIVAPSTSGYMVPGEAVQWDGCCNLVFIKSNETTFVPRKITINDQWRGNYIVSSGIRDGDLIVTKGSFLLKTEILKGNIGAGCCEEH
ncbi:MAG: efflux RND transporter periplasmic adaptor subunit [bacterium]|nr:efflux RND transporter periplasmic adaptor subunit [bacterium]